MCQMRRIHDIPQPRIAQRNLNVKDEPMKGVLQQRPKQHADW